MTVTSALALSCAPPRVLLVEDDYLLAEELVHDLDRHGVTVDGPVATCQGALSLLVSPHQPDMAILDVRLADGDVYPLADALVARGIPFVFATAFTASDIPDRFAHVACWQKPFSRLACIDVLSRWATATLAVETARRLEDRSDVAGPAQALVRQALAAQARAARLGHHRTAHCAGGIARMIVELERLGEAGSDPRHPDDPDDILAF